jgi:hypothetical protein
MMDEGPSYQIKREMFVTDAQKFLSSLIARCAKPDFTEQDDDNARQAFALLKLLD